jgi:phage/plasmid-like protein (TIGR03299 family)
MSNNAKAVSNPPTEQFVPWNGLGAKVSEKDSLDTIMKNADLQWQAKRSPVLFAAGDTIARGTSDVLYRSDNNLQLGIVSNKYNIIQPREVLSLYKDLVSLEGWKLDVVGQLDGGKRVWALAKTDSSFFAGNVVDDIIDIYMLLSTTFDGSTSFGGKFVAVRAASGTSVTLEHAKVTVHHKSDFDPKKVKEKLNVYKKASEIMEEQVKSLVDKKISDKQAVRFLIDVLESEGVDPDILSARQANIVSNVFELYKGQGIGSTWNSSNGTAWGLLNALTQHIDYNVGRNDNNRIRAAWFGGGETLKIKAMNKLLSI